MDEKVEEHQWEEGSPLPFWMIPISEENVKILWANPFILWILKAWERLENVRLLPFQHCLRRRKTTRSDSLLGKFGAELQGSAVKSL